MGRQFAWLLFLVFFLPCLAFAASDVCGCCQKEIRGDVYTREDKVSHVRRFLCSDCLKLADTCYLCGMPVLKDFTRLPDGRVICKRDVGAVVLDDREAAGICDQVKKNLDRQFIRFITIPENNVTVQLMDRVRLQELYKVIGNDFSCPNTLGCTETKTNAGRRAFEISILSGQPREDVMTTCVHEYAHTWIIENLPPARKKKIGKDAVEGFCELLAFLFAEEQGLQAAQTNILANHYTRGQVQLFIAACRQYGFADIVDWMKSGDDPLLRRDDLSRVRRLEERATQKITTSSRPTANRSPIVSAPPQLPTKLVLQGIVWSKTQPMATVSGRNFDLNQEAVLQLRDGPVTVRCLEIHPASVVLQTNNAAERLVLELK